MKHSEVEKQARQALNDYLPVMGLGHWRIDLEVVSADELMTRARRWGTYPPGDIYALVHPMTGLARTIMLINDEAPFAEPGCLTVAEIVLHELGHLVAGDKNVLEHDGEDAERFLDWMAATVVRVRTKFAGSHKIRGFLGGR